MRKTVQERNVGVLDAKLNSPIMQKLEYKGYLGSVEFSEEDGLYFGKLQNAGNALVSYEGKTLDELESDFQNAVDDYILLSSGRL